MSSLRRTLCTTVGLAALGAAFATPAFAAPELPSAPSTDELGSAPDFLSGVPALPTTADLPPAFNFEMPHVNTAVPPLPATPQTQVGGLSALDTAKAIAGAAR